VDTNIVIDGQELVSKFKNQIEYLDFARYVGKVDKFERKRGKFIAITNDYTFRARCAIIATGITPKRLNVPGEKEFLGRGVSYSTVSHAPVFAGMEVAVIGEGNQGLQAAMQLADIAAKVSVIGVSAKYADSPLGKKIRQSGKAVFLTGYVVKAILGNEAPDRLVLSSKKGEERIVPARGIFVEIGYTPNSQPFARLVKTTRDGRIMINGSNQTSIPGLFAAGDVTNIQAQQVLIAMGEGANAALNAADYLLGVK
jgi:alkyl hydroperoxide reductase subunit F